MRVHSTERLAEYRDGVEIESVGARKSLKHHEAAGDEDWVEDSDEGMSVWVVEAI